MCREWGECGADEDLENLMQESSRDKSSVGCEKLFVSPSSPNSQLSVTAPETPACRSAENPLVAAGLVPSHLADIFCTVHREDENRPKRRHLTNARVLTENEYYDMLKEKKQKEKEEQEAKERRKNKREKHKEETEKIKKKREEEKRKKMEERERKKKEMEEEKQRKKEEREKKKEEKKKTQEEKNGKRKMKRAHTEEHSSTDEDEELNCPPSRPPSSSFCRLPAAVAVFDSSISDSTNTDDSGGLCGLCNEREPQNCGKKCLLDQL